MSIAPPAARPIDPHTVVVVGLGNITVGVGMGCTVIAGGFTVIAGVTTPPATVVTPFVMVTACVLVVVAEVIVLSSSQSSVLTVFTIVIPPASGTWFHWLITGGRINAVSTAIAVTEEDRPHVVYTDPGAGTLAYLFWDGFAGAMK